MNRTLLFTVLLAAAGVAQAHDEQRIRDIDKVNGSITAEAGQFYGDLSTVNGGIDLQRGAKVEDVETVNGGIEAGDEVVARSVSTVNGSIRFSGNDLEVPEITALLFGGPLKIRGGLQKDGRVLITADGSADIAQLRRQSAHPALAGLSGATP